MYEEVAVGITVGLVQSALGHPLDTIKTRIQNNQSFRHLRPSSYYRGALYPTAASLVFNAVTFPVYEHVYARTQRPYVAGGFAGLVISPIHFGFEIGKIRRQTAIEHYTPLHFKGLLMSTLRTTIGLSAYFGVYRDLTESWGPAAAGAAAGVTNWTLTYPFNVLSTRQVARNISIRDAWRLGHVYGGYVPCIARALIVNSATFYTYEKLQRMRKEKKCV